MLVIGAGLFALILVISSVIYQTMQPRMEDGRLKVVATFYPLAYFAQEIGGEYVSVKQLIPDNMEVHSWHPSTSDILAADEADIIIYNGANLDLLLETDILPNLEISNKIIVETTEDVELPETEANHEHDHELHDPHTWLSPFIAKKQAQKIYEVLIQKDPSHEEYYTEKWEDLRTRFEELDEDYIGGLSNTQKEVIFVTHNAFGYLAERYEIEQHGVIGISADEQPSTSVIASLVDMMIDHETYVIYVDLLYSDEYAQTLKSELESRTGHSVQILNLYFMLGPIDGMDYFEQQEKNLENLKIGLEAS
ncbi:MAG: zinc ABC transporter substrate-binding protein [Candidatus Methylarchaceae archaeon HK01B]|nr:zinc ABC transporter substrate-binding protein [Candidatus Methylarchaceae archaeon HK01B]